jgi:hypothetical protein
MRRKETLSNMAGAGRTSASVITTIAAAEPAGARPIGPGLGLVDFQVPAFEVLAVERGGDLESTVSPLMIARYSYSPPFSAIRMKGLPITLHIIDNIINVG